MKRLLIGLDIGTSSIKAGLYDLSGNELALSFEPISTNSPHPGWAEQDPRDWWNAAKKVLKEISTELNQGELAGIGLSGQCPGHTMVDAKGEPIGSAIIWRDQRAQEEARWITENISAEKAREWTGREILGDATQPPARILWLKGKRKDDFQKMRWLLQPKDFIGKKLTGLYATDYHSAYSLTDSSTQHYSEGLVNFLGLDVDQFPVLLPPEQKLGDLDEKVAVDLGLPYHIAVIAGTIDAYCDNLAGGVIVPGNAVDVAGTSEIVSLSCRNLNEGNGVFLGRIGKHAFLCGPTQAGGETLHWLSRTFYSEFAGKIDYATMEKEAAEAPTGSGRLIFLPYLQGERAPIWDAHARGIFMGLTLAHDRRHVTRSVFEGIGYAVRHVLETCEETSGVKAERIMVCGGGSRSIFWNQVKADISQRQVNPLKAKASACLGAAMLAAVGCREYKSLDEAYKNMNSLGEAVIPDPSTQSVHDENYEVYRQVYLSVKTLFDYPRSEILHELSR